MDEKIYTFLSRILLRFYKEEDDYTSIILEKPHKIMFNPLDTLIQQIFSFFSYKLQDKSSKRLCQAILIIYLHDIIKYAINKSCENKNILELFIKEYNKQHNTNYTSQDDLLEIIFKIWSSLHISGHQLINDLFDYGIYWANTHQGHKFWSLVNQNYHNCLRLQKTQDLIKNKLTQHYGI